MSLVEMIDSLINDIGSGLNESTIRSRLLSLREQAEAQDARLKELEAKVVELEAKAQPQNLAPNQEGLDETSIRFLKLLFGHPMTISQIVASLNISRGKAEYHRDVLIQAGMISLPMVIRMGRENPYHLLPEGRKYLVENNLV